MVDILHMLFESGLTTPGQDVLVCVVGGWFFNEFNFIHFIN